MRDDEHKDEYALTKVVEEEEESVTEYKDSVDGVQARGGKGLPLMESICMTWYCMLQLKQYSWDVLCSVELWLVQCSVVDELNGQDIKVVNAFWIDLPGVLCRVDVTDYKIFFILFPYLHYIQYYTPTLVTV